MAFEVIWAPAARLDLKEISTFISEDKPAAARRFVNSLIHAVERLSYFPESGRIVPELDDPVIREVIRTPFRIVYRVNVQMRIVEIVRVWHAARGIPDIQ